MWSGFLFFKQELLRVLMCMSQLSNMVSMGKRGSSIRKESMDQDLLNIHSIEQKVLKLSLNSVQFWCFSEELCSQLCSAGERVWFLLLKLVRPISPNYFHLPSWKMGLGFGVWGSVQLLWECGFCLQTLDCFVLQAIVSCTTENWVFLLWMALLA